MIHIGEPYITEDTQYAYLRAKVNISNDTSDAYRKLEYSVQKTHWRFYEDYPPKAWGEDGGELYFAVPKEFKFGLCEGRSEAFVVAMLWYALMTHSDIEFEAPLSEKMFFGITQLLIPALYHDQPPIHLHGPITDTPIQTTKAVGTGMSCGIDSLYSLNKYTNQSIPEDYRLTHLAYFNMGAIFHPNRASKKRYPLKEFYEITDRMSLEKMENAAAVAKLHNLQLIYMFSNLDKDFYRGGYGYTGVYRNCAMVLALQNLFHVYYCSSAGWPSFFELSLTEGSEHYEALLCTAFSTESLQFVLSDYATRLEKTISLSDDDTAKQYLDVCFNFNNCGKCSKCYRTLLTLDAIGKVDNFSKVFDVPAYKENKTSIYAWLISTMHKGKSDDDRVFALEIYEYMINNGMRIPFKSYLLFYRERAKSAIKRGKKTLKKLVKRIVRR